MTSPRWRCLRAGRVADVSVINPAAPPDITGRRIDASTRCSGDRHGPPPCLARPIRSRLDQMFRAHQGVVWRVLRCRGCRPTSPRTRRRRCSWSRPSAWRTSRRKRALLSDRDGLHVAQATRARTHPGPRSCWSRTSTSPMTGPGTIDDRRSALDMVGKILSRVDPPLVEVFVLYEIAEYLIDRDRGAAGRPARNRRLSPAASHAKRSAASPVA